MQSIFNKIKQTDASGNSYWMSRDLCVSLGYSDYSKFKKVIDKAEDLCQTNNKNKDDHFAHVSDMIQIIKSTFKKKAFECISLLRIIQTGKKEEPSSFEYLL